jgi:hypothetical protein
MKKVVIATFLSAVVFSYIVAKLAMVFAPSGPSFVMSFGTCIALVGGAFCGLLVAFSSQGSVRRGIVFGVVFLLPSLLSTGLMIEQHKRDVVEARQMMPVVMATGMLYFDEFDRKHINIVTYYDLQQAQYRTDDPDLAQVIRHMEKNIKIIGHYEGNGYGYVISRGDLLTYPIRLKNATENW